MSSCECCKSYYLKEFQILVTVGKTLKTFFICNDCRKHFCTCETCCCYMEDDISNCCSCYPDGVEKHPLDWCIKDYTQANPFTLDEFKSLQCKKF